MKHRLGATEVLIWGICGVLFLGTAVCYRFLPAQVPVHWNLSGDVDSYAPRLAAFGMPTLCLGISALLKFMPVLDPRRRNYEKFRTGYDAFRLAMALFYGGMQAVMLTETLRPGLLDVGRLVTVGVGLVLCVTGNFMPKFRHNYFMGIRTPWTLESEDTWYRTHRFAGPIWFCGGLLLAVVAFVVPSGRFTFLFLLGVLAVLVVLPFLYSYFCYKTCAKH